MNTDMNHPWFKPLWRRVLVIAICAGVALWDLSNGEYVWALIFGGLGGYGIYVFFIAWGGNEADKQDGE